MNNAPDAFRMAPWRKQVRNIVAIIIAAVIIGGIAMMYLSISENMTDIKLQLEEMQEERNDYSRKIADLITDRGMLTSYTSMRKRAEQAGYIEIDFTNDSLYKYLIVDGYTGSGIHSQAPVISRIIGSESLMKPEYTQSLQQWLAERIAVGKESYEKDY